ncbi:MAG: beta strand repeat-containing protein [Pirellulales bacterium]
MRTWMMLVAVLVLLFPFVARAQTWDGGGANDNWTEANNWSANVVPANNGTATPNFAGVLRPNPVLNVGVDLNGITFDNNSGAFNIITLNGSVLTLRSGGITNNNAATGQAISPTVQVGASQTWGGAGGLTIAGAIALGSNTVTIDSPATVSLGNAISGSGKIVKNGAGALVLTGSNTNFSGGITHNSGVLAVGINAGLGTGLLTINGGTFEGTGGARSLANAVEINGDFGIVTGTAVTFTGAVSVNGARTLTNGIANLAISGSLGESTAGSKLTLAGAGNLTLSGTALTLGTSLQQNSGTLTATGLVNSAGRTLTQNAGTFTGSLINRGTFILNGGTHSGNITNEAGGDATLNSNLTVTAALNNSGTLRVGGGRTLTFGTQHFNNTGTLELAGGTLAAAASTLFVNAGVVSGFGTISTTGTNIGNTGLIQVDSGNLTLASNVYVSNAGSVQVPAGRSLVWNSAATFNTWGLIELDGGTLDGTGRYINIAGGEIRGGGRIAAPLTNNGGLIRATGATPLSVANLMGDNTSGGELRVDDGATMNFQNDFSNSGTIVLAGANASLNLNSLTNAGTFRGAGRVTGTVMNNGIVRAEEGTLSFAGAGNTNADGGQLQVSAGSQLFYTQGLATNAGTIALTGGALDNNNVVLANPGRIEGYGTLRTGGLTNTGVVSVGGALDVLGSVNNSNAVSTASGSTVRFFGPVSGAGSFTGTGTVVFLGSLAPGASPAIVNFGGDVALDGVSSLEIELGGTTPGSQYDRLNVAGDVSIGGALDVSLINGFVPSIGNSFQIINAAGGVSGTFSSMSLPAVAGGSWRIYYQPTTVALSVVLAGDYNGDGRVDAADYNRWRDTLGQTGAGLAADGNGNGQIDAADYNVWKSNFGQSAGAASVSPVPEPEALCSLLVSSAVLNLWRRRSGRIHDR